MAHRPDGRPGGPPGRCAPPPTPRCDRRQGPPRRRPRGVGGRHAEHLGRLSPVIRTSGSRRSRRSMARARCCCVASAISSRLESADQVCRPPGRYSTWCRPNPPGRVRPSSSARAATPSSIRRGSRPGHFPVTAGRASRPGAPRRSTHPCAGAARAAPASRRAPKPARTAAASPRRRGDDSSVRSAMRATPAPPATARGAASRSVRSPPSPRAIPCRVPSAPRR